MAATRPSTGLFPYSAAATVPGLRDHDDDRFAGDRPALPGRPVPRLPALSTLTSGCPPTSTDEIAYPIELEYAYDKVSPELFDAEPVEAIDPGWGAVQGRLKAADM